MTWDIQHGDCVELMAAMPEASVDAIVTDPPYGLEFMGKAWDRLGDIGQASHAGFDAEPGFKGFRLASYSASSNLKCQTCQRWKWDHEGRRCECGPLAVWPNVKAAEGGRMQAWHLAWTAQALRVLKPGGHLLAFGGTRTFHRLTCALEDAGFEIRDCLSWMYGAGFPKSARVNRDPRFCQCGAPARNDVRIDHEQPHAGRSGTVAAGTGGVRSRASAHRSRHEAQGSLGDCLPAGDCDDAQPRPDTVAALVPVPSRGYVPEHSRSAAPLDGQAGEREHSPSQAQCSGRPSSQDSEARDSDVLGAVERTSASTSPADTFGSGLHIQGNGQGLSSADYGVGFPACKDCGLFVVDGFGTALKPAWEPIILARKPLVGTVAGNVQAHGTGALNVDGCRIPSGQDHADKCASVVGLASNRNGMAYGEWTGKREDSYSPSGRWPANVLLTHSEDCREADCAPGCPVRMLDEQSGELHTQDPATRISRSTRGGSGYTLSKVPGPGSAGFGDVGGASRFFYTAKASSGERHYAGLNAHPTVKPVDLMRWLVRLVTPPGGIVLDPFCGSGSTGVAALAEGFRFLGLEREAEYVETAKRRIAGPLFAEL